MTTSVPKNVTLETVLLARKQSRCTAPVAGRPSLFPAAPQKPPSVPTSAQLSCRAENTTAWTSVVNGRLWLSSERSNARKQAHRSLSKSPSIIVKRTVTDSSNVASTGVQIDATQEPVSPACRPPPGTTSTVPAAELPPTLLSGVALLSRCVLGPVNEILPVDIDVSNTRATATRSLVLPVRCS